MGRESNNDYPIVMQSSIALLQERFKQLQRMKEMRVEKELLRKEVAETKPCLYYNEQPLRLFFQFLPVPTASPSSHPQTPLCLWSGSGSPNSMHLSVNKFQDSDFDDDHGHDVDTSLHL